MKTKDLRPGTVYAKRGGSAYHWGIPVSPGRTYETMRFDNRLRGGKAVLVLVPGTRGSIGPTIPAATQEQALAVARTLGQPAFGADLDDLNRKLHEHGVHLELWQPSKFEGKYDEVIAERKEAARQRDEADTAKWQRQESLEARWDALRAELDIEARALVTDGRVSFGERGFEQVLDRLEALVGASPLIAGQI